MAHTAVRPRGGKAKIDPSNSRIVYLHLHLEVDLGAGSASLLHPWGNLAGGHSAVGAASSSSKYSWMRMPTAGGTE